MPADRPPTMHVVVVDKDEPCPAEAELTEARNSKSDSRATEPGQVADCSRLRVLRTEIPQSAVNIP